LNEDFNSAEFFNSNLFSIIPPLFYNFYLSSYLIYKNSGEFTFNFLIFVCFNFDFTIGYKCAVSIIIYIFSEEFGEIFFYNWLEICFCSFVEIFAGIISFSYYFWGVISFSYYFWEVSSFSYDLEFYKLYLPFLIWNVNSDKFLGLVNHFLSIDFPLLS